MSVPSGKWRGLLCWAPRSALVKSFLICVACVASLAMAREPIPLASAQARPKSSATRTNSASRVLQRVGEAVAKAVLDKDVETLLRYDRADLRSPDAVSLKNPKSDLYCYLFDSDCITWGNGDWRSVYDKLSQAHQLEIKVRLSRSPADRQLYGSLLFYDASAISQTDLRSPDFLCKQGPEKFASWRFRLENGKWKPVTPLFDSETEAFCAQ